MKLSRFLKWLYEDAPLWVFLCALPPAIGILTGLLILTLASFAAGLWIIPVLLWIVLPGFAVYAAYVKARESDD